MNKDHVKKFLPLLTSIAEGKQMQYNDKDIWVDIDEDADWYFDEGDEPSMWRVKPEPQLVPFTFEDAELIICKVVIPKSGNLLMGTIITVTEFGCGISANTSYTSFDQLLDRFTFLDGSPCGKLVETSNK